jgi:hypothetical protein
MRESGFFRNWPTRHLRRQHDLNGRTRSKSSMYFHLLPVENTSFRPLDLDKGVSFQVNESRPTVRSFDSIVSRWRFD